SDLVLGLGPSFTYLTEGTHSWIDEFDQIWEDSIDPIIIIGARWTTGFRIYLNKRSSARPVFIYSGSSLGVPQLHYELNGNNTGSTSMQIGMYLGAGLML
ncbi:MAG: hypothetical protein U9N32_05585, partial [Spirochaetota bacterium]|nr:hypothetical protein [Spirochaetota bacterium]